MIAAGQVVQYREALEPGDEEARYVVLEAHHDTEPPRALLASLGTGFRIVPTCVRTVAEIQQAPFVTEGQRSEAAYLMAGRS